MRRVKVTWPNGSTLIGTLKDTERNGKNIAFGPDDTLAIMYVVPEGDEHFPHGILHIFEGATITYEEPTGFATVISARRREDSIPTLWTSYAGGWVNQQTGFVASWDDFVADEVQIIREGVE